MELKEREQKTDNETPKTFRCKDTEPDGKTPCPYASRNSKCSGPCKYAERAEAKIAEILRR